MAIQFAEGYTSDVTATNNENGFQVERVHYIVNDDTSNDMEMRILTSSLIPSRGDQYSSKYPTMLLKTIKVESPETGNYIHWTVTLNYDTVIDTDAGGATDPTSLPAQISSNSSLEERLVDVAYAEEGKTSSSSSDAIIPIESTTGERLQVSSVIAIQEKTITINRRSYNPDWESDLSGTINKGTIRIAGTRVEEGQAMLRSIGATNNFDENGNLYYSITMSFQIRGEANGFLTKTMNLGYYTDDNGTLRKILDKDITENEDEVGADDPVAEPAKLDKDSKVIPASSKGEAHFLVFQDKRMASWSSIPIPHNQSGLS